MMNFIMVPTIIGIITLGIYKLFELFARRRERMMLIEKLNPEQLPNINLSTSSLPLPSQAISIGCLLIGLGLGLLVGFCINANIRTDLIEMGRWDLHQVIFGGSILLFGGFGLIASVFVERWLQRKHE